jgi:hypothetical protein
MASANRKARADVAGSLALMDLNQSKRKRSPRQADSRWPAASPGRWQIGSGAANENDIETTRK